jgi:hypothetical protein
MALPKVKFKKIENDSQRVTAAVKKEKENFHFIFLTFAAEEESSNNSSSHLFINIFHFHFVFGYTLWLNEIFKAERLSDDACSHKVKGSEEQIVLMTFERGHSDIFMLNLKTLHSFPRISESFNSHLHADILH